MPRIKKISKNLSPLQANDTVWLPSAIAKRGGKNILHHV